MFTQINFMSPKRTILPLTLVLLALSANFARAAIVVNFDENGIGTVQTTAGTLPLISLGNQTDPVDPANGLKPLVYDLAGSLGLPPALLPVPGDINLFEILGGAVNVSDVVRFTPNGLLVVYSDRPEPGESPVPLADVGFSGTGVALPNSMTLLETGPEAGPNGLFNYAPNPNDPGAMQAAVGPIVYNFLSDPQPVPEPRAIALMVMGLGSMFLRRRR